MADFPDAVPDFTGEIGTPGVDPQNNPSMTAWAAHISAEVTAIGVFLNEYRLPEPSGADQSAAINAVIAEANAAGGGIVRPASNTQATYLLGSTVVLRSNVHLVLPGVEFRPSGVQTFTLLRNLRATDPTGGAVDENMSVEGLTLNGLSPGIADDGRLGYGIGLYGCERVRLEGIRIHDMPFSAIEISDNQAGEAHGVRDGAVTPTRTGRITLRNISVTHTGWQRPFMSAGEIIEWGDPGFGIIVRSGARLIDVDGADIADTYYGGLGVGQMSNLGALGVGLTGIPTDLAHVAEVRFANFQVDQRDAAATTAAPALRVAFAYAVEIVNGLVIGNAATLPGSSGVHVRAAGSSEVEGVTVTNVRSIGNTIGFIVNSDHPADATIQDVGFVNCSASLNTGEGFRFEEPHFTMVGCRSFLNGTYGAWVKAAAPLDFDGAISGCAFWDNGTVGATTDAGLILDDAMSVAVTGCVFSDTRAGAARTQERGIREITGSDNNVVVGNIFRNHPTAGFTKIGAATVDANNLTV